MAKQTSGIDLAGDAAVKKQLTGRIAPWEQLDATAEFCLDARKRIAQQNQAKNDSKSSSDLG